MIREGSCGETYGNRRVLPFPQNLTCWSHEVASRTELRRKTVQIERVFRDQSMFKARRRMAAGGTRFRCGSKIHPDLLKRATHGVRRRAGSDLKFPINFPAKYPVRFSWGDLFIRVVMAVRNLRVIQSRGRGGQSWESLAAVLRG